MRNQLSVEDLKEGAEAFFKRKSLLTDYQNPEVETLFEPFTELLKQGYSFVAIFQQNFAPFLLSDEEPIMSARDKFLKDNSVQELKFVVIPRTGEVIAIFK